MLCLRPGAGEADAANPRGIQAILPAAPPPEPGVPGGPPPPPQV